MTEKPRICANPECGNDLSGEKPHRRYCCRKCAGKGVYLSKKKEKLLCRHCRKEFTAPFCFQQYCSGECRRKAEYIREAQTDDPELAMSGEPRLSEQQQHNLNEMITEASANPLNAVITRWRISL